MKKKEGTRWLPEMRRRWSCADTPNPNDTSQRMADGARLKAKAVNGWVVRKQMKQTKSRGDMQLGFNATDGDWGGYYHAEEGEEKGLEASVLDGE
uniref:Uncharacterized protein n=1 Tax=Cucumis melo TaxID=3656 RepID=A0A9I9DWG6_CUCME